MAHDVRAGALGGPAVLVNGVLTLDFPDTEMLAVDLAGRTSAPSELFSEQCSVPRD
jgi:hypothetical protein